MATTFVTTISISGIDSLHASEGARADRRAARVLRDAFRSLPPLASPDEAMAALTNPAEQGAIIDRYYSIVTGAGVAVGTKSLTGIIDALCGEIIGYARESARTRLLLSETVGNANELVTRINTTFPEPEGAAEGLPSPVRSTASSVSSGEGGAACTGESAGKLSADRIRAEASLRNLRRAVGRLMLTAGGVAEAEGLRRRAEELEAQLAAGLDELAASQRENERLGRIEGELRGELAAKEEHLRHALEAAARVDALEEQLEEASRRGERLASVEAELEEARRATARVPALEEELQSLREARSAADAAHRRALEDEQLAKRRALDALAAREDEFRQEGERLQAQLREARAEVTTVRDQQEREIRAAVDAAIQAQKEAARAQLAEATEAHTRERELLGRELEASRAHALGQLEARLKSEHQEELAHLRRAQEEALHAAELRHSRAMALAAEDSGGAVTGALEAQRIQLEEGFARERDRIHKEAQAAEAAMVTAHARALAKREAELTEERERAFAGLRSEYEAAERKIRDELGAQIDAIKEEAAQSVQAVKDEYERRLRDATAGADAELAPLREQIRAAGEARAAAEAEARALARRLRTAERERDEWVSAMTHVRELRLRVGMGAAAEEAALTPGTVQEVTGAAVSAWDDRERRDAALVAAVKSFSGADGGDECPDELPDAHEFLLTRAREERAAREALAAETEDLRQRLKGLGQAKEKAEATVEQQMSDLHARVRAADEERAAAVLRASALSHSLAAAEAGVRDLARAAEVPLPEADDEGEDYWLSPIFRLFGSLFGDYRSAQAELKVADGGVTVAVRAQAALVADREEARARLREAFGGEEDDSAQALAARASERHARTDAELRDYKGRHDAAMAHLDGFSLDTDADDLVSRAGKAAREAAHEREERERLRAAMEEEQRRLRDMSAGLSAAREEAAAKDAELEQVRALVRASGLMPVCRGDGDRSGNAWSMVLRQVIADQEEIERARRSAGPEFEASSAGEFALRAIRGQELLARLLRTGARPAHGGVDEALPPEPLAPVSAPSAVPVPGMFRDEVAALEARARLEAFLDERGAGAPGADLVVRVETLVDSAGRPKDDLHERRPSARSGPSDALLEKDEAGGGCCGCC